MGATSFYFPRNDIFVCVIYFIVSCNILYCTLYPSLVLNVPPPSPPPPPSLLLHHHLLLLRGGAGVGGGKGRGGALWSSCMAVFTSPGSCCWAPPCAYVNCAAGRHDTLMLIVNAFVLMLPPSLPPSLPLSFLRGRALPFSLSISDIGARWRSSVRDSARWP